MIFIERDDAYKAIRDEYPDLDRRSLRKAIDNIPSVDPVEVLKRVDTKCWSCRNACGGCDWSRFYKPVGGWIAIRKDVSIGLGNFTESYVVLECPYYEGDEDGTEEDEI